MFGIKGRDTFNKPLSDRAQIATELKKKWLKYFPYFLMFVIFSAVVFIGYAWYVYVYTKELTPDEKVIYINQKKQEVIFREKKFDEIKEVIIERQKRFQAPQNSYNDIFYHGTQNTME